MTSLWEIIVTGGLAIWIGLSIVHQFYFGSWPWLRRRDPLQLIPGWTFFAPEPGRKDLHLDYRDVLDDGRCSDWIEIPLVASRGPITALWHPKKRHKKVLLDAAQSLLQWVERLDERADSVKISVPYLLLLQTVVCQPSINGSTARQFRLAESRGFADRERRTIFQSETHAL